jgi:hypothetical protein
MSERRVGALVVLSAEHLSGIITERDYAREVIAKGRQSRETLVREIMSTPVLFVRRTRPSSNACTWSRRGGSGTCGYGRRPSSWDASIGDLVNWIIGAQKQTIRHLHNYIAGSYPA